MSDFWLFILTIFASAGVGTVSSFTGGGGGLLGVPYLLAIGLSPIEAIGTGKFGGMGVAAGSIPKYLKAKKVDKNLVKTLLPITLAASVIGPSITFSIDEGSLEVLIGVIILVMAPTLLLKKDKLKKHKIPTGWKKYASLALYGVIATMQAAFGSGTGSLLILVLVLVFGMPAINAGATRRLSGIPLVTITTFIFILNGHVVYLQAIAVTIGNYIGGRIGAKYAIKKGNDWVRYALALVLMVVGIKLLTS